MLNYLIILRHVKVRGTDKLNNRYSVYFRHVYKQNFYLPKVLRRMRRMSSRILFNGSFICLLSWCHLNSHKGRPLYLYEELTGALLNVLLEILFIMEYVAAGFVNRITTESDTYCGCCNDWPVWAAAILNLYESSDPSPC